MEVLEEVSTFLALFAVSAHTFLFSFSLSLQDSQDSMYLMSCFKFLEKADSETAGSGPRVILGTLLFDECQL